MNVRTGILIIRLIKCWIFRVIMKDSEQGIELGEEAPLQIDSHCEKWALDLMFSIQRPERQIKVELHFLRVGGKVYGSP